MELDTTSTRGAPSPPPDPFWRRKYIRDLSLFRSWFNRAFPQHRLTQIDYAIAVPLLTSCFFSFANGDLDYLGQNSLNFLFGNPLDFYENAKKYQADFGGATYPPTLYAIFALWLTPWKLIGVLTGPDNFPQYLVYWLKLATTITYLTASYTFYIIAKEYFPDDARAKYATALWFTAPLAVFSQFIFSQTDIFYVQLVLLGYLMFLRRRLPSATLLFGLSTTFKLFPAASFFPLLLLLEKRPIRIVGFVLLFTAPTLLIHAIYGHSPAFTANPINQLLLERLYVASIAVTDNRLMIDGSLRIYLLPLTYAMLCGITFFWRSQPETSLRDTAYVWLTSSVLFIVPILWHPQWLMLPVPAIVLTSMLSGRFKEFLILDLLGMLLYIAAISFIFPDPADTIMFRGDLVHIDQHNSYHMATLFNWFGDHSGSVFHTGFSAYLLLHVALKYRLFFAGTLACEPRELDYGNVRQHLYVGLAVFIIPAAFSIWKDLTSGEVIAANYGAELECPLVAMNPIQQTFTADGRALKSVSLLIGTSGRRVADTLAVELVDAGGMVLGRTVLQTLPTQEIAWHRFQFQSTIALMKNAQYAFRVISANGSLGNTFSLFATSDDAYPGGYAIIRDQPKTLDLNFRIEFLR